MNASIFVFIFAMWILLLIGGGILVAILGPVSVSGFGDLDSIISSGIKAIIAIILVIVWVFALSKIKNWIFQKQIKS